MKQSISKNIIGFKMLFVIFFLLMTLQSQAQVSGISGGKLSVPDAGTLEVGVFEFEPSFSVSHASKFFNTDGSLDKMPGHNIASELLFRITTGVSENLEVGTTLPSNLEQIDFGAKYAALKKEDLKLSLAVGVCLPAGNNFFSDSNKTEMGNYSAVFGTILTKEFSDQLSLDILLSYSKVFGESYYHDALSFQAGLGYNISERFQGVIEINSFGFYERQIYSGKLSGLSGFTFNVTESLLFVSGVQFDLFGKNDYQNFSYFGAFTISLK